MGLIGDIIGTGLDIFNTASQFENQQYMRGMQRESWNREDNATQRRVADLKAAGLSPVLAAGAAAQSSSPISTGAPQAQMSNTSAMQALQVQKQNIAQSQEQVKLMRDQQELAQANTRTAGFDQLKKMEEMAEIAERRRREMINNASAQWNLDLSKRKGSRDQSQSDMLQIYDMMQKAGDNNSIIEVLRRIAEPFNNFDAFKNIVTSDNPWQEMFPGLKKAEIDIKETPARKEWWKE